MTLAEAFQRSGKLPGYNMGTGWLQKEKLIQFILWRILEESAVFVHGNVTHMREEGISCSGCFAHTLQRVGHDKLHSARKMWSILNNHY